MDKAEAANFSPIRCHSTQTKRMSCHTINPKRSGTREQFFPWSKSAPSEHNTNLKVPQSIQHGIPFVVLVGLEALLRRECVFFKGVIMDNYRASHLSQVGRQTVTRRRICRRNPPGPIQCCALWQIFHGAPNARCLRRGPRICVAPMWSWSLGSHMHNQYINHPLPRYASSL